MLESHKELFQKYNTTVVSINLNDPELIQAVQAYTAQEGYTFPIVLNYTAEKDHGIMDLYQVKTTPSSYIIDSSGTIVESHHGPASVDDMEAGLKKLPAE